MNPITNYENLLKKSIFNPSQALITPPYNQHRNQYELT